MALVRPCMPLELTTAKEPDVCLIFCDMHSNLETAHTGHFV